MLAALSDVEINDVLRLNATLRAERFPRRTDDAIHRLIGETRDVGYCLQPGLVLEDSWALGVMVRDRHEQPVASISMAAIKSRLGIH